VAEDEVHGFECQRGVARTDNGHLAPARQAAEGGRHRIAVGRGRDHELCAAEGDDGRDLTVELVAYLRPEQQFDSEQALVAQIELDVQQVRDLVGVPGS